MIDIRGTNSSNKGATLMLIAITQALGDHLDFSAPTDSSDYIIRAKIGLYQTLHQYRFPRASALLGNLVPTGVTRRFGMVPDSRITGVLDASGFAYSDSFGYQRSKREALFGRGWARRGVPKVMLPQAFGPFRDSLSAKWSLEVLEQSAVIYARDEVSVAHLHGLGVSRPIERVPDFTIGLKGRPISPVSTEPFMAIVPNGKMMHSGTTDESRYLATLSQYAAVGRAEGLVPVVIVHESSDLPFARRLADSVNADLFSDRDPLALKSAIGQARVLVSSRFHALVGGLSQGIPSIALGWSHKYRELLNDFGVREWSIGVDDAPADVLRTVLRDKASASRILDARAELDSRVADMWSKTLDALTTGPRT